MTFFRSLLYVLLAANATTVLYSQALSAASRGTDLSAFYGVTRSDSGLAQNHSTSILLAVDATVSAHPHYSLDAEVRATNPLSGELVSESNAAGGIRIATALRAIRPYANIFYGRAQLTYANGGIRMPGTNVMYTQSRSSIYMMGLGANFDVTATLSIRFDQQFERLSTPVTTSGHSTAMPMTLGLVYRVPYLKHGHAY